MKHSYIPKDQKLSTVMGFDRTLIVQGLEKL